MRKWQSSAAYRIAFINFGAIAGGLALLGVVVFGVMHLAFTRQLDSMLSDEARTLTEQYSTDGLGELAETIAQRENLRSHSRMLYAVFSRDGHRIYGSLPAIRPGQTGLHRIQFEDPVEGPDEARAMIVDLSPDKRLVVAADSDWLEQVEQTIIVIFGLAFLAAVLVGLGGALLLGSYLQRRLESISDSAEAIIRGDIRQRMPVGMRGDEFDRLASTLNRMLDRIELLLENLRQVSSDVAHDLRTPLARLRNHLERAAHGEAADQGNFSEAIRQLDDALALFAAILRIGEVESGETKRYFVPVDLTALVTEVAESFAPEFERRGQTFLWSIEDELTVEGDRDLLAQALINLIENAQRHTPSKTLVRMLASSAGGTVFLQVSDNGPGVPEADLPRITKRFARLESSRSTAGHGLGLSLVGAVAKLHGGRLALRGAPGLSATIEIPAREAPRPNVLQRRTS
jgi:signal transduction histidine kinase